MSQLFSMSYGITRVFALLLLACFSAVCLAHEEQLAGSVNPPLRISVSIAPPYVTPEGDGYLNQILNTLFERSHIDFELVSTPARRGLKDARSGAIDAAFVPVLDKPSTYPELVLLNEPILRANISGLYTRDDISIASVEDFFHYRLAHIRGWRKAEELFKNHPRVTKVRSAKLLMNMLASDRVDVVFFPSMTGRYIANEIGLKNLKVSDFYIDRQLYLQFNKRHAGLVPVLKKELVKMKSDGTMESILIGYESEG